MRRRTRLWMPVLLLGGLLAGRAARAEEDHLAAMAREHAHEAPVATPAAGAPRSAVEGREVPDAGEANLRVAAAEDAWERTTESLARHLEAR